MKAPIQLLLFAFAFILLSSCGDKKEDQPERKNYMEAKINGASWSPSSMKCTLLIDGTYNFRIVDFTASSGGKTITLEASDDASSNSINSGTRTFDAGNAYFSYGTTGTPYHSVSGTINITDVDASSNVVSGTFDFTVEDNSGNQVHVSAGKLVKVSYTVKNQ
jgi:hypothetical protein